MTTAQDVMIRDVVSVSPDVSIRKMLLLFADRKVSGAPVLGSGARLVGMVTIGDLLRHLEAHLPHAMDVFTFVSFYADKSALSDRIKDSAGERVRTIMTTRRLESTAPGTGTGVIVDIFGRERFKKLPVINERREVLGVISRGDLIRHIVQDMLQP